jgi:hypothetical protein
MRNSENWTATEKEAAEHASPQYVKVRCIFDTLMQVQYDEKSRKVYPFLRFGPQIKVREVVYDHLKQLFTINDQEPTRRQAPYLVSFAMNLEALTRKYRVLYFNPLEGILKRDLGRAPAHCAMCDDRSLNKQDAVPGWYQIGKATICPDLSIPQPNIPAFPDASTCIRCSKLRRPCVWITNVDLFKPQNPDWEYKYIRMPAKYTGGPTSVPGPPVEVVMADCPVEEEVEEDEAFMAEIIASVKELNEDEE